MWIWRLNNGRRARSQVRESRKLTQCLLATPGGTARVGSSALGQLPRNTTSAKLHTGGQAIRSFCTQLCRCQTLFCTCLLTSSIYFTYMIACYHHNSTCIHTYLSFTLATGVRPSVWSRMCQDILGHVRNGATWCSPPPPPTSLEPHSAFVSVITVICPRSHTFTAR